MATTRLWCIAFMGVVSTMVDTIYTIEQVAEILHIKPRTLREWIRQEKVKAFKLGGLVRIHEEDLQEFIDSARKKVRNTERREMEGHDHTSTETA
jgi:excisionase family DNA binding protein